jgi:hypothetical protein
LSSTLIYGKGDAVLVDPSLTIDQAKAVGDWVEASGKKLDRRHDGNADSARSLRVLSQLDHDKVPLPRAERMGKLAALGRKRLRISPSCMSRRLRRHRALPSGDGLRPSPARMMPPLTSSSLNLPMASRSSVEGMMPASLSFVAFTRTITRIVLPLLIH